MRLHQIGARGFCECEARLGTLAADQTCLDLDSPDRTAGQSEQHNADARILPEFFNDILPLLLRHLAIESDALD